MRKIIFSLVLFLFVKTVLSQIQTGFDKYEGRDMISLCNSYTQIRLFNTDSAIVPKSYKKIYTSGVYGLDNKFQIWRKGKIAIVVFRGSTAKKSSWLENMYSVMILAKGSIVLPGMERVDYRFAKSNDAKVHAGWSLGVAFIIQDLIHEIQRLNARGVYDFILTGHSQGGALCQLSRAYLENLQKGVISNQCRFKTYAFASPMIGNEAFIREYTQRYERVGTSFSIFNPDDLVPKLPQTVHSKSDKFYSLNNISRLLDSTSNFTFKDFAFRAVTETISKDPVEKYIKLAGYSVHKQIEDEIGPLKMPKYTRDLEYVANPNRIVIGPFDKLEDQLSFNADADSLSAETKNYREQLSAYRGGKMYQHKPYNYYLYYLKKYFTEDYVRIIDRQRYLWNQP